MVYNPPRPRTDAEEAAASATRPARRVEQIHREAGEGIWVIEDPRAEVAHRATDAHFHARERGGAPACGAPLALSGPRLRAALSDNDRAVAEGAVAADGSPLAVRACRNCVALVRDGRDLAAEHRLRRQRQFGIITTERLATER